MTGKVVQAARRWWVAVVLVAGVLGGSVWAGGRGGVPLGGGGAWRSGDWWAVSTRVPQNPLRMATLGWVEGPVYLFTVREPVKVKGAACWRVEVEQLTAEGARLRTADLFYTRERLDLVDARYYGPGGQEVGWPAAAAYLRLPVVLPRLDGVAPGRPVAVPRQGVTLRAEALELSPGQTQVWSDAAPWWVRFSADGLLRAELVDASWWHQSQRPSRDWRKILKGAAGEAPISPYKLPPTAPALAAPTGPLRSVTVRLWLDGRLVGELRQGKVPWRQGTVPLAIYSRRNEQVGVLYCSLVDPAAGQVRLDRLVLIRPQYLDQALNGLEGNLSGKGPLKLAADNLRVEMEMGALQ